MKNIANRRRLFVEVLEPRLAPASFLKFTDVDGDKVTITASVGDISDKGTFANVGVGQQLQVLDLTGVAFQGANITTTVIRAAGGDGLVNIGHINATGRDLGTVTIKGDLGQIDAGDATWTTAGLQSLTVRSLGRFGLATQAAGGSLESDILGRLGALTVRGDIARAIIYVSGASDGKLGPVHIGGSIVGGSAANSGQIQTTGDMGAVVIGGDIVGGTGDIAGAIDAGGKLVSVTVAGSLIGGAGFASGTILSNGSMGPATIGHDVIGGVGSQSGRIEARGRLGTVSIGGSLLGGLGTSSGDLVSGGHMGVVKIAHDVKGSSGDESGKIDSGGKLAGVFIGGSLIGGSGNYNTLTVGTVVHDGQIFALGDIGQAPAASASVSTTSAITIGHDVLGGAGHSSGMIFSNEKIASVSIGGSLCGGTETSSGALFAAGGIGPVKIGHNLAGGPGQSSGLIFAKDSSIASVTVGGSLVGSSGNLSGVIFADAGVGPVKIGHDVVGGSEVSTGLIVSGAMGKLAAVTIAGSLIGGSQSDTGEIRGRDIGSVTIGHDLVGGSISGSAPARDHTGYIESTHRIGSVTIGGSIIAGINASSGGDLTNNASIRAGDNIGALTVHGSLIGNVGAGGDSFVIISARGQHVQGTSADLAIGSITIGGRVEFAQVYAGYDTSLTAQNADAQIGAVSVGGDWASSTIIAGAINLGDDDALGGTGANADNVNFGDLHDHKFTGGTDAPGIISKIGSITIAGQVFGTPNNFSNFVSGFGFVAEQIGALTVGGAAKTLHAGPNNDGKTVGRMNNMTLHEIDAAVTALQVPAGTAKLVNPTTVVYTDIDGDHVTATISKPLLNAGNVNNVFTFDNGAVAGPNTFGQQLQLVNLAALASNGLGLTITVTPGGGDGLANVGYINSTGFDLGVVTVPGDLGRIDAGDATAATPGVKSLSVRTMGRLDVDTQPDASGTFTPSLHSEINGGVGSLTLKRDIIAVSIHVAGSIGPVTIGGSLIGGKITDSGNLRSDGGIGVVTIGRDLQGGKGINSGLIVAGGKMAGLTVGGSLLGGSQSNSGQVSSNGDLGPVKIGHDVLGGSGGGAGFIGTNGKFASVIIGGSLLGGPGSFSGGIFSRLDLGPVTIRGDVVGGSTAETGFVKSTLAGIASITVAGSLLGGAGENSGEIRSGGGDIGPVKIAHDLQGGSGASSGLIFSNARVATVAIGGSLLGGAGPNSGETSTGGDIGGITIGHDLRGGPGGDSGDIDSAGKIASLFIGGAVIGGPGFFSGSIHATDAIGSVAIGHDVLGGTDDASGIIEGATIGGVTIRGSLVGGSSLSTGAVFGGEIGPVRIGQNLIGGSISGSAASLDQTGYIESGHRIASVFVGGSIISGIDDNTSSGLTKNASIRAGDDIGAIVVKGSLIGNVTAKGASPVIISARGQAVPGAVNSAIAAITIGGRVERAFIFGDYSVALAPQNAGAQIGTVTVGRDWVASNLVVGVVNLGADDAAGGTGANADNVNFGDAHDQPIGLGPITHRIASIIIGGIVVGTDAAGDHFGFSAVAIGAFKSHGFTALLTAGTDVIELSPITTDVTIRDLA